jgi:hypothetical protein
MNKLSISHGPFSATATGTVAIVALTVIVLGLLIFAYLLELRRTSGRMEEIAPSRLSKHVDGVPGDGSRRIVGRAAVNPGSGRSGPGA